MDEPTRLLGALAAIAVVLASPPGAWSEDYDADGVQDALDNCPYWSNADQLDGNGDGVGDLCQCGDVDGDGFLTEVDATRIDECYLEAACSRASERCCLRTCDADANNSCNFLDAELIRRVADPSDPLQATDLSCRQRSPEEGRYLHESLDPPGVWRSQIVMIDGFRTPILRRTLDLTIDWRGRVHVFLIRKQKEILHLERSEGAWERRVRRIAAGSSTIREISAVTDPKGRPCLSFIEATSSNTRVGYHGCGPDFAFGRLPFAVTSSVDLNFAETGRLHLVPYLHNLALGFAHRVRHYWIDADDWRAENVPVGTDRNESERPCSRSDPAGRIHVAFSETPSILGDDHDLIYLNWSASEGWSPHDVAASGAGGSYCSVSAGADGNAHILYANQGAILYATNAVNEWSRREIASGLNVDAMVSRLELDAATGAQFAYSDTEVVRLVRVSEIPLHERELGPVFGLREKIVTISKSHRTRVERPQLVVDSEGTRHLVYYSGFTFSNIVDWQALVYAKAERDRDEDGVADSDDNCADQANAPTSDGGSQPDRDGDGIGDACECGDVDGDGLVNATDARLVQLCTVGQIPCDGLCDTDGDGTCTTTDARLIQRLSVGQLTKDDLSCAQRP